MIEVTDEMIDASMRYFNNSENAKQSDRDWIAGAIKINIELHEANKPKPEPVAWMSPNKERLEFSRIDTVYGSHTIPLYTTPPTREPLTKEQRGSILKALSNRNDGYNVDDVIDETEKAHGIGANNA